MQTDSFTRDDLGILMEKQGEPCVSILMPTHEVTTEIQQDKIRFKNLLRKAKETYRALEPDGPNLLEPAERFLRDSSFWMHQGSGLASFLSAGLFLHYRLPISLKGLVVVTDSFHLKPLLPLVGEECGFYILALSQNETRLFKGNRFNAREIEVSSIPASIKEALKYDDPEKQLQFHTGTSATGKRPAIYHGHGVGTDDSKDNILRYLRQIDRGLQNLLAGEYSPLVVAGVEYLISLYREASTYPYLMEGGITGNPEGLSAEELHPQGWESVQPYFEKDRRDAEKRYHRFAGTGKAANNLREVLPATFHGRVEILFVADGMEQWGRYDPVENTIELHRKLEPGDQDLLNLAAVQTFANGGTVYLAEPGEVPGDGLLAALFRY
jgi:hypothetical protein